MADFSPNNFLAYLSTALAAGTAGTTVVLDRVTTLTGETLETADLAALGRGIITVNPEGDGLTSYPEHISFTGVTAATKTLTGCTRGLTKEGVASTSLMRYHPVGTPVIISFGVHNVQDIIDYMDDLVAGLVVGTSTAVIGTAGETLVAGNLVYLKNDGKWWKCDADTASTIENVQLGIAQGAGAADASITNGVMRKGLDTNQSSLSAGTTYYASNTAGGISSTVGTNTRAVGVARSSTSLYFDPDNANAISVQNGTYVYAADSVGTDAYAITVTPAIGSYVTGQKFRFKAGTANTGAATLAVSGLTAKDIKKDVSATLATGDILANQIVEVVYDGTNFQLISRTSNSPIVRTYLNAASPATWTKPDGLKYIVVEVQAGGAGGSGTTTTSTGAGGGVAGGYGKKTVVAASLGATETVTIGAGGGGGSGAGGAGSSGGTSSFGTHVVATGDGVVGTGGDINIIGGPGVVPDTVGGGRSGDGGNSILGFGARGAVISGSSSSAGSTGGLYGGGGAGGMSGSSGDDAAGGAGAAGIVIVTEYY